MKTKSKYIFIAAIFLVILLGISFGLTKCTESRFLRSFVKIEGSIRSYKFAPIFGQIEEVIPQFRYGWRESKTGGMEDGEGVVSIKSDKKSGNMHVWWVVTMGNYHVTRIESENGEKVYQE